MKEEGLRDKEVFVTAIRAALHDPISLETLPNRLAQPALQWKVTLNTDGGKDV